MPISRDEFDAGEIDPERERRGEVINPEPVSTELLQKVANTPAGQLAYDGPPGGVVSMARELLQLREWKGIAQQLGCVLQAVPHEGVEIIGAWKFQLALMRHLRSDLADVSMMVAQGSLAHVVERDLRQTVIDAAYRPKPFCRDCADNDGTCPNTGELCDPFDAALERLKREHSTPQVIADALHVGADVCEELCVEDSGDCEDGTPCGSCDWCDIAKRMRARAMLAPEDRIQPHPAARLEAWKAQSAQRAYAISAMHGGVKVELSDFTEPVRRSEVSGPTLAEVVSELLGEEA